MQLLSRLVAGALLATMLAGSAGASCLLPASLHSSSSPAACHHKRTPSRPQPVSYRCCASRTPFALPTNDFPQASAVQPSRYDPIGVLPVVNTNEIPPTAIVLTSGPPGAVILRI